MPSPLIQSMIEKYGYPVLTEDTVDEFTTTHDESVLFFSENPNRFPESDDVAMILPELVNEYGHRFSAAVIDLKSQRKLQGRYGFTEWPTLVFLRKDGFLGSISRVQDWNDYILKINALLTSEAKPLPGIGIPITQTSTSHCS